MDFCKSFIHRLNNSINDEFEERAIELFQYQSRHNLAYNHFINELGVCPAEVSSIYQIPFLPISFFKKHRIKSNSWNSEHVFESSGTTGVNTSKHEVENLNFYFENALELFEEQYGDVKQYHFLALLPSYLERNNSSLVYMIDHFIKESDSKFSNFYLDETELLIDVLNKLNNDKSRKTILVGVTFALLDLVEKYDLNFPNIIVMETGGMKGRRKELIREEVHSMLKTGFGVKDIQSEYGMTELLSQGYSKSSGIFHENKRLKVIIRDVNDPLSILKEGNAGGINVIDLANIHTCAFIETQDIGRKLSPNTFEVLGRFDNSDIRGCSLMTV